MEAVCVISSCRNDVLPETPGVVAGRSSVGNEGLGLWGGLSVPYGQWFHYVLNPWMVCTIKIISSSHISSSCG